MRRSKPPGAPSLSVLAERLRRRDDGVTLVELVVAMAILSIVMLVFTSTLGAIQSSSVREGQQSINNDQARLAIEQLDREIRSGNVLYNPASESPAYYSMRIYTQANATTRQPAPGYFCDQWRISGTQLQTRYWPPLQPEDVSNWRVVADGIVNTTVSPNVKAFELDPDSSKAGRVVNITLLINNNYSARPNQTVRIQEAITGRNTSYGFPQNVCTPIPA
jgi:prepilin-type N-terminal cleavage/methylation domain-containing protein